MNELQFFPTPPEVIELMVKPFLVDLDPLPGYRDHARTYMRSFKILEPSAGRGAIPDYLIDKYKYSKSNFVCVEIDAENRMILQGKGYKVVELDFLQYSENYFFDMVLMNPPFIDADSHILKAWSILNYGEIVSLCNAETIRNPYTREREVLAELISRYGSVEYIGSAFANAEIPTDVEIAIIRLHKEKPEALFDFDATLDVDTQMEDDEFVSRGELASINMIESLVAQYNKARDTIVKINELEKIKQFYTKDILPQKNDEQNKQTLATTLDELKAAFWKHAFNKTKLGDTTTSKFRDDFYAYQEQNKHVAFTYDNAMSILGVFWIGYADFMKRCIADTFDAATRYHEKNRVYKEGWKTNSSYMLNKKIIMPDIIDIIFGWKVSHRNADFLHDLEKCCCFLTGKPYKSILTIEQALEAHVKLMDGNIKVDYWDKFNSEFFSCSVYKKGTMHLTWLDMKLWSAFNVAAADGKAWVGGGY